MFSYLHLARIFKSTVDPSHTSHYTYNQMSVWLSPATYVGSMYPQWQCSCSQQDEGVTVVHVHGEVGGEEEMSEVLTVCLGWESHMVDAIVML